MNQVTKRQGSRRDRRSRSRQVAIFDRHTHVYRKLFYGCM